MCSVALVIGSFYSSALSAVDMLLVIKRKNRGYVLRARRGKGPVTFSSTILRGDEQ